MKEMEDLREEKINGKERTLNVLSSSLLWRFLSDSWQDFFLTIVLSGSLLNIRIGKVCIYIKNQWRLV